MSGLPGYIERELQWAAFGFMVLMAILRLRWFIGFPAERERQTPVTAVRPSFLRGILSPWVNLGTPRETERAANSSLFFAQFIIFHLAIFSSFGLSLMLPFVSKILEFSLAKVALAVIFSLGVGIGCYRVIRRFKNPALRLVSTTDDFFSPVLITFWLSTAFFLVITEPDKNQGLRLFYFLLTDFLWVYIPFSKNIHFLSFFFTRYYFGKSMSHRGVFPIKRAPRMNPSPCLSKEN